MPSNGPRGKYWCWTLNNYTAEEEEKIQAACVEGGEITFLIYGHEVGEAGTPHLQGYVEFSRRKTLSAVKAVLGPRLHLEKRRGTPQEASDYCTKEDDNPFVFGTVTVSEQGRRTDVERALEALDNGATDRELWKEHAPVMLRYEKAMKRARVMRASVAPLTERTLEDFVNVPIHDWAKSQVIVGPSGYGKTEYAKALLPKALFVSHMDELAGLNEEHEGIIFDDMSFEHLPRTAQIHLVDQDNGRAIHIRYTVANIPAKVKKIFLTNTPNIFTFDPAINRRVEIHTIHNKLFN